MLLDTYVNVIIKNKQAQTYYQNKFSVECEVGKSVKLSIQKLNLNCHINVRVKCELCNDEKNIDYCKYNSNKKNYGFYSCKKCSNTKRKETMNKKYNVDNPSQILENRNERSEWMKSAEFKNKSKNTLISKYGVDSFSKTNEFKVKLIDINNNRTSEQKQRILEKISNTVLDKFGTKHYFLSDDYKKKSKETFLLKYGNEIYANTENFKTKIKESMIINLGVDNPFKSDKVKAKIITTKILKGIINDYTKIDKVTFKNYCRKIDILTKRNKIELLNNWDGTDFYDGADISKNFKLSNKHKNYPTIDHKISKFEGFIKKLTTENMSNIDNLCITTRSNNSKKSRMNYIEYILKISA